MFDMLDAEQVETAKLYIRPGGADKSDASKGSRSLPADLLEASVRRLSAVALMYAAVFFLAGIFPNVLCVLLAQFVADVVCHPTYFTTFRMIGPPVLSVLLGIAVFWLVRSPSLSSATKLTYRFGFRGAGQRRDRHFRVPGNYLGGEVRGHGESGGCGHLWPVVGIGVGAVVHNRYTESPTASTVGGSTVGQRRTNCVCGLLGTGHQHGHVAAGWVFPRACLPLHPDRWHGLCRRTRGVPTWQRGAASP